MKRDMSNGGAAHLLMMERDEPETFMPHACGTLTAPKRKLRTCDTCDTCKFWDAARLNVPEKAPCTNDKLLNEGWPPIDGLAEADTMGYNPCIYTGPKFGCIHHSEKS